MSHDEKGFYRIGQHQSVRIKDKHWVIEEGFGSASKYFLCRIESVTTVFSVNFLDQLSARGMLFEFRHQKNTGGRGGGKGGTSTFLSLFVRK